VVAVKAQISGNVGGLGIYGYIVYKKGEAGAPPPAAAAPSKAAHPGKK
jgi:hypothetical protein